jgi:SAM-dependent methyltransferase
VTSYEWLYTCLRPFDQSLTQLVHAEIRKHDRAGLRILDVGGRRSNYTIGLKGAVTISDLPRRTDIYKALDLGATDQMRTEILAKRSNVTSYIYDDMTRTAIAPHSYDLVIAIEVLEHVDQDAAFVANVERSLTPGGIFLMTTPNGDFVPEPFPDHRRHYRRLQLIALLQDHFDDVDVRYIVNADRLRQRGGKHQHTIAAAMRAAPLLFLGYQKERFGFGGRGPGPQATPARRHPQTHPALDNQAAA